MKSTKRLLIALAGVAAVSTGAQAAFTSTFNITSADYILSGFATGGDLSMDFSNIIGTYALDIPAAGGSYLITVESNFYLQSYPGGPIATFSTGVVSLGVHPSPGPSSTVFSASAFALPDVDLTAFVGSPFALTGASLAMNVDLMNSALSGAIGAGAFANFTISGGNTAVFDGILNNIDIAVGGGDGIMDGVMWGDSTMTVSVVPLPVSAFAALPLIAFGGIGYSRRKRN